MKKLSLMCGLVAAGLLGAACSSGGDEPAAFPVEPQTIAQKLEATLGSRIDAVPDGRTGMPYLYVAVDNGKPAVADTNAPSLAFLSSVASDLGVSSLENELGEPTSVVPATEETAGTARYAQHVPGTELPVFDAELVVSTRLDGSVAFVQPSLAAGLAQVRTTPALSSGAARDTIRRVVADASDVEEPRLGVSALDLAQPRLAYRADVLTPSGGMRATIDANDGSVISVVPLAPSARALAAKAASYYAHAGTNEHPSRTDPNYVPNAAGPIVFDEGTWSLRATTDFGVVNVRNRSLAGAVVHVVPPPSPRSPTQILTCDLGDGDETPGVAVDVQGHVLNAMGAFQKRFGRIKPDALGRPLELVVHDNSKGRDNAFFSSLTNSIHFGDGRRGVFEVNNPDPDPEAVDPRFPNIKPSLGRPDWFRFRSAATSPEIVAHELAHAIVFRATGGTGVVGEAGAIAEGVADVLANQAMIDNAEPGARFWLYGEDQHYRGLATRNLYRPSDPGADGATAAHWSQLRSVSPLAADGGNVHFNSTVVSQPWLIMGWGGYNEVSKLGVTAEIGLDRATTLYWETVKATTLWENSIKGFARKMISYQTGTLQQHPTRTDLQGRWVRDAVICAWNAVGVLTPEETKRSYGISCPSSSTLDTTSCANKRDGLYCDSNPKIDGSFIECERGAIK